MQYVPPPLSCSFPIVYSVFFHSSNRLARGAISECWRALHRSGWSSPHLYIHSCQYSTPRPAAHLVISLILISSPLCHMTRLVMTVPISLVAPAEVAEPEQEGDGRR